MRVSLLVLCLSGCSLLNLGEVVEQRLDSFEAAQSGTAEQQGASLTALGAAIPALEASMRENRPPTPSELAQALTEGSGAIVTKEGLDELGARLPALVGAAVTGNLPAALGELRAGGESALDDSVKYIGLLMSALLAIYAGRKRVQARAATGALVSAGHALVDAGGGKAALRQINSLYGTEKAVRKILDNTID